MSPNHMQVYVRRWRPSTFTLDLIEEIILLENGPDHLKKRLSELSGIPAECVSYAKVREGGREGGREGEREG